MGMYLMDERTTTWVFVGCQQTSHADCPDSCIPERELKTVAIMGRARRLPDDEDPPSDAAWGDRIILYSLFGELE